MERQWNPKNAAGTTISSGGGLPETLRGLAPPCLATWGECVSELTLQISQQDGGWTWRERSQTPSRKTEAERRENEVALKLRVAAVQALQRCLVMQRAVLAGHSGGHG